MEVTTAKQPQSTSELAVFQRHAEIEELDAAIGKLAHLMNSANYQLMVLIREFDERAGWLKWGFTDCLSWLKWRCDLGTGAARDKLRIAHALKELPLMSEAFASGKLSYTKVRALTRVATDKNEAELIEMATRMTARHVEEHCKQRHNASSGSTASALSAQQNTYYRVWHDDARGTVHFSIELPVEEASLVEKAIEKSAVKLSGEIGNADPSASVSHDKSRTWSAIQADALVQVSKAYLDGTPNPTREDTDSDGSTPQNSSTADHYQVVVHVDEAALAGFGAGGGAASTSAKSTTAKSAASEYPIETVRRLCCDGSLVPLVENDAGEPLAIGRKSRVLTTAIRRALWARDNGCAFPGCCHTRFVDAHHIKHWANGGETTVDNLVLLCSSHHKLVHEGGYSVSRDHAGELFFRKPNGKVVPHCGYRIDDVVDDLINDGLAVDDCSNLDLEKYPDAVAASAKIADYLKNSREFFESRTGVSEQGGFYLLVA